MSRILAPFQLITHLPRGDCPLRSAHVVFAARPATQSSPSGERGRTRTPKADLAARVPFGAHRMAPVAGLRRRPTDRVSDARVRGVQRGRSALGLDPCYSRHLSLLRPASCRARTGRRILLPRPGVWLPVKEGAARGRYRRRHPLLLASGLLSCSSRKGHTHVEAGRGWPVTRGGHGWWNGRRFQSPRPASPSVLIPCAGEESNRERVDI